MEKLGLIFLELRFACFLNNRGNPRSPVLLHTLTTLHTPQLSSLPSSWSLPFLGCSSFFFFFFFFIWKRDSVTAFPACRLEPGERELCYSSPTFRGSYHLFPRPCTHTQANTRSLQDLTTAATEQQSRLLLMPCSFFFFSLIQNLEGRKIKICSLLSVWTEQLLSRVTGEFNIHIIETPVNHEHYFFKLTLSCIRGSLRFNLF